MPAGSTRAWYAEAGVDHMFTISMEPTMYRVEASDDNGSISFAGSRTFAEAEAELLRLKAGPDAARYTHWDILKFQPMTKVTVLDEADYESERRGF